MLENIIEKLPEGKTASDLLKAGKSFAVNGLVPSAAELFLVNVLKDRKFRIIITEDELKATEFLSSYRAFDREASYYPARDPMFYKADIRGDFLSEQRLEVVKKIYAGDAQTIVTCPEAFMDRLASFSEIKRDSIHLAKGDSVDETELAEKLVALGYSHEPQAAAHGEFSIRGSIVDIFPYGEQAPFRMDLWGDEIEKIKIFDPESQRSIEETDEFTVFAGGDKEEIDGGSQGFIDYFNPADTVLVFYEAPRLFYAEAKDKDGLLSEDADSAEDIEGGNALSDLKISSYDSAEDILKKYDALNAENDVPDTLAVLKDLTTKGFPCIYMSALGGTVAGIKPSKTIYINSKNIPSYNGRMNDLVADIKKYRRNKWNVTIFSASDVRSERLRTELLEQDAASVVVTGAVTTGFEFPDIKESVISEVDIFGRRRMKSKRRKRYNGDPIKDFTDLNVGDYVVHEQHGVGIYRGIERMASDGSEKDFMKIEYANNASLYVLATQFERVQKYSGAEGVQPKLNRLGGKEWTNTKARVQKAVKDIAAQLVRLYAERHITTGYSYGPDTVWQREFEDEFEFEETADQLDAIEAVKSDMESTRTMDRLICGDVGFGKTEVAIRAAFKAVQEGKQVAFLCPTTILAKQHFNTIAQRMKNYPVTVKELSRFATAREQKTTLEDLKKGMVDIVVGTHRLLSKDVMFKNLGLLVIDEEQRFGVGHKEKIKELKKDVDVLTLSATPIPRTLHMSLSGIRDMSLLTEPPMDRVSIQTYVMEYSEETVREAILRETRRGGQVYYVYNRTGNIDMVAAAIQEMIPEITVAYAHGQMSTRELENCMADFVDGAVDVLVSTTIVETGLDIPNVNTIIIQDADRFGLSQLYQLRGRVGRSNRTAYAFLLYKKDKLIREVAEKRLTAIREFSDLGSGIKIAMRDLEIRGAGNVLGAEQSGHMEAVGYELYCKMLNQAVAALKGTKVAEDFDTSVDLNIDGYIPDNYIPNSFEKLNMYKKISAIQGVEDMEDIKNELLDRFGEIPTVTENLLSVALIKSLAHGSYVSEVSGGRKEFKIIMWNRAPVDGYKLNMFLHKNSSEYHFTAERASYFTYKPDKVPKDIPQLITCLGKAFNDIKETFTEDKDAYVRLLSEENETSGLRA